MDVIIRGEPRSWGLYFEIKKQLKSILGERAVIKVSFEKGSSDLGDRIMVDILDAPSAQADRPPLERLFTAVERAYVTYCAGRHIKPRQCFHAEPDW